MGVPNLLNKLSPSLLLTFAGAETLDPRITFTRASTATFTGSNGLIQTAAINAPRFDYNPTTLAPLGLLIEEQRTNLVLNSATLATQNVTVTAVAHTLSFYGTGTVTLSGTSTAGPLLGTGAYPARSTLTFTPTAGTLTLTVSGTVEFAQLEIGAFPTSYIPTVASQVTRSADLAVMTGTNFSSWYNQAEGTLFGEYAGINNTQVAARRLAEIGVAGLTTNRFIAGYSSTSNSRWIVTNGGVTQANIFVVTTAFSGKFAGAYAANNFQSAVNATLGTEDTSGTVPTVNALFIGSDSVSTANTVINGTIRQIAYYPRRLTDSQLQAITD
jgi:hypothetical protein